MNLFRDSAWDVLAAAWIAFAVLVHYLPQLGIPVPFELATAAYALLVIVGVGRIAMSAVARGKRSHR